MENGQARSPFGYAPVALNAEKRLRADIVPDPLNAGYVKEMYDMYATGRHSNSTIRDYLRKKEVTTRSGKYLTTSAVYWVLTNSFYYGKAYSRKYKQSYDHSYAPLVTKELFDTVQSILTRKNQNKNQVRKAVNPFSGILKCGTCGCSICFEIKRGKPYYACTNAKKIHKREYTQQDVLLDHFRPLFKNLILADEQIDSIVSSLRQNHEYKAKYYLEQTVQLNEQFAHVQGQRDRLLDLLLDGRISQQQYEEKLTKIDAELGRIGVDRAMYSDADTKYHVTAKYVLGLARRAGELFECANDEEKNELLKLILSNATLSGKNLTFAIRKPFDTIVSVKGLPIGLAWRDSFRTFDWVGIYSDFDFHLKNINRLVAIAR